MYRYFFIYFLTSLTRAASKTVRTCRALNDKDHARGQSIFTLLY
jgi:hypothetical protein